MMMMIELRDIRQSKRSIANNKFTTKKRNIKREREKINIFQVHRQIYCAVNNLTSHSRYTIIIINIIIENLLGGDRQSEQTFILRVVKNKKRKLVCRIFFNEKKSDWILAQDDRARAGGEHVREKIEPQHFLLHIIAAGRRGDGSNKT